MLPCQDVKDTFISSLYVLSWSTMGTRHGSVNFSVFVFKQFRRGSTQQLNETIIIFWLLQVISFIVFMASGGDEEKRAYFTTENLLRF